MLESRWFGNCITKEQGGFTQVKNEVKHTAHSSYRCEYHLLAAACNSDAMANSHYPFQGSTSTDPSGV